MKQYIVEITDRALKDNEFPERIHVMESEPERTVGLRQLLADNFSAFYLIKDDRVIVTRVLYSASDISKRLLDN